MIRLREVPILGSLIIVAAALSALSTLRVQATASEPNSSKQCSKRDLEIHFGFFESPKNYFNFVVQGLNISDHVCTFDYDLFDPGFSETRSPFKCRDCGEREREGYRDDSVVTSDPVVRPGEIVRKHYRWRTAPESGSISCFRPKEMDSENSLTWTLATPSLMKQVCSDISVVGIDILAPRISSQTESLWTNEYYETLTLTALRSAYYIDEEFPLTISYKYTPPAGPEHGKCLPVFVWHRSADGTVRVEEHRPSSADDCQTMDLSFLPNKVFFSSEWNSEEAKRLSNYGDQELQAFQQVDNREDPHLHFAASDILHVRIEGSDNPNLRNWTRSKGLAANILLDRDTYKVGENIPLHLAIANFDATDPVFSWDPLWDPCISVNIQVLDEAGHPLAFKDRFLYPPVLCNGHGFGPRPFERGKITSLEWSLKQTGWLPKSPGNYTVVLNWCTSTGTVTKQPNGWKANQKPYATVQAKATIHIVPAETRLLDH